MFDPIFAQICPCPNKEAVHFEQNYIMVGLNRAKDNVQFVDLRKDGPVLKSTTLRSMQSSSSLHSPNDKDCEVQLLKQSRFDKKLFVAATSHNNTVKLLKVDGLSADELYSYESLPGKVMTLETSMIKPKVFLGGEDFNTTLTFDA